MKRRLNCFSLLIILIISLCLTGCFLGTRRAYGIRWQLTNSSVRDYSFALNASGTPVRDVALNGTNTPIPAGVMLLNNEPNWAADLWAVDLATNQPVVANWALSDPTLGSFTETTQVISTFFRPAKIGTCQVTATIEDVSVSVPICVYPGVGLNVNPGWGEKNGFDFDSGHWNDVINNSTDVYINPDTGIVTFPYGAQIANVNIASVSLAPIDGYTLTTIAYDEIAVGATYLIKTSDNNYVKLMIGCKGNAMGYGYFIVLNYRLSEGASFIY